MTPERDGVTEKYPAILIPASTLSADNTPASVDLLGYREASILLHVGVGGISFSGTNKIEFKLTHSDDDSTYTDVTSDDLILDSYAPASITTGIVRALTAAHAAATIQKIGYIGGKRYLKLLADFSGTHGTGTPIAAQVVREDRFVQGTA